MATGMRAPSLPPPSAASDRTAFSSGLPSAGSFALRRPSLRGLLGRPNSTTEATLGEDGRPRARRSVSASVSGIIRRRSSYNRRPLTAERPTRPRLEEHVSEEPDGYAQNIHPATADAAVTSFSLFERADGSERQLPATAAAPEFGHLARVESPQTVGQGGLLMPPSSADPRTTGFGEPKHADTLPIAPPSAPAAVRAFSNAETGSKAWVDAPVDNGSVQSRPSTSNTAPQIPIIVAEHLVESPPRTPTRSISNTTNGSIRKEKSGSSDVAGPRFKIPETPPLSPGAKNAGDPSVYQEVDVSEFYLSLLKKD